jgi:hypothetical protein
MKLVVSRLSDPDSVAATMPAWLRRRTLLLLRMPRLFGRLRRKRRIICLI